MIYTETLLIFVNETQTGDRPGKSEKGDMIVKGVSMRAQKKSRSPSAASLFP